MLRRHPSVWVGASGSYGSSTIVSNGSWSWCLILLWGRLARLSCKAESTLHHSRFWGELTVL